MAGVSGSEGAVGEFEPVVPLGCAELGQYNKVLPPQIVLTTVVQ